MENYSNFELILRIIVFVNMFVFCFIATLYLGKKIDDYLIGKLRRLTQLILKNNFNAYRYDNLIGNKIYNTTYYHLRLFVCLFVFPLYTYFEIKEIVELTKLD